MGNDPLGTMQDALFDIFTLPEVPLEKRPFEPLSVGDYVVAIDFSSWYGDDSLRDPVPIKPNTVYIVSSIVSGKYVNNGSDEHSSVLIRTLGLGKPSYLVTSDYMRAIRFRKVSSDWTPPNE